MSRYQDFGDCHSGAISLSGRLSSRSTGNVPKHLLRKHAAEAEPDPFAHQRSQQVFSLFTDFGQISQFNDELTWTQSLSGVFACIADFARPW
ncbi:MAG TPA: hypothetical protein VKU19_21535 [Bryobacteraceae bacterium]|nr:hypothetical protein [Bryobacteraceae bacterium]